MKISDSEMINLNNLIKLLKTIRVDQSSVNYDELFNLMNLIEIAISVHYELFAKHVDSFTKLHTTLQSISGQIKDTGGLYTAGTVVCIRVVYDM